MNGYKWKLKNNKTLFFQFGNLVERTVVSNKEYYIDNVDFRSNNILELFDKLAVGERAVFNNGYYFKIDKITSGSAGSPLHDYKQYDIRIYDNLGNLSHRESSIIRITVYDDWTDKFGSIYVANNNGVKCYLATCNRTYYINHNGQTVLINDYLRNGTLSLTSQDFPLVLPELVTDRTFFDVLFLVIPNEVDRGGKDVGEPSIIGGQNGDLDDTTDIIPIPDIPTLSLIDCGMVSAYKMTASGLKALANELWSDNSELLENLKKMFLDNPMESIMSLSLIPLNLTGKEGTVQIGNYPTEIGCTVLNQQYITVDCGSINISLYWGNSLDYDPYTKFELYLPMVGGMKLSADEIMGKTLSVKYTVDIVSGVCIAYVLVNNSVLYTASGNCMLQLPITGRDASNLYSSIVRLGASALPTLASGGTIGTGELISSGLQILSSKPHATHSGVMSGNSGVLNVKYPVLTINRVKQSLPENFYKFKGYTSNITEKIGDLFGYTEIEYIRLENIDGITDSELSELENILKTGFIVQ